MLIFFPGCILCELLTGYPLLPGEDEGMNYCVTVQINSDLFLRGSTVLHY